MASHSATVSTADLGEALDLLDGLSRIMRAFDAEGRGRELPDPLLQALEGEEGFAEPWAPLRYQDAVGSGWLFVAENTERLRARLVEDYGRAVL